MHEIEENVYICPNYGGAYSHRRALYFGAYIEKTVVKILEIKAVVTINDSELNAEILYNNTDISIEILQQEAKKKVLQYPDRIKQLAQFPLKIFLLDKPFPTNFQKESLGGLRTKTYFDVKHSGVNNSESLAKALNGNNWESFEKKSF